MLILSSEQTGWEATFPGKGMSILLIAPAGQGIEFYLVRTVAVNIQTQSHTWSSRCNLMAEAIETRTLYHQASLSSLVSSRLDHLYKR
jgi:hypothetical protein